jgi:cold shock CspA family protein
MSNRSRGGSDRGSNRGSGRDGMNGNIQRKPNTSTNKTTLASGGPGAPLPTNSRSQTAPNPNINNNRDWTSDERVLTRGGGRGGRRDREKESAGGGAGGGAGASNSSSSSSSGSGRRATTINRNDDAALREEVRQESLQRRKAANAQTTRMLCGVIVAIRESFGFIQPLAGMSKSELASIAGGGGDNNNNSNSTANNLQITINSFSEQIYFSDREAYNDVSVGDEVYYSIKETPKGPQAAMLRRIPNIEQMSTYTKMPASLANTATNSNSNSEVIPTVVKDNNGESIITMITAKGVVIKDCEPNRNNLPGLILVKTTKENLDPASSEGSGGRGERGGSLGGYGLPPELLSIGLVSFTLDDISSFTRISGTHASNNMGNMGNMGGGIIPIAKGDEVTFQYRYAYQPKSHRPIVDRDDIQSSSTSISFPLYVRAVLVSLNRSAKEVLAEQKLNNLIKNKTTRYQGVVETCRHNDGYGYIKPVDSLEPIFFRYDSIVNDIKLIPGSTDNTVPDEPISKDEEIEYINGIPIQSSSSLSPTKAAVVSREHLSGRIFEGLELEFFLVNDDSNSNGGSNSNSMGIGRNTKPKVAVGITTLPKGTIHFEETIAKNVLATVIIEPKIHPREEPGILKLHIPVQCDLLLKGTNTLSLSEIELWSRCAPKDSIFRVGDVIQLDVNHYKPEKLQFARNISIVSYRKISRHIGRICSIRDEGYGFIKINSSSLDDAITRENCYFRTNDIIIGNGNGNGNDDGNEKKSNMKQQQLVVGVSVSFEILLEEVRGSREVRCRAVRVMTVNDKDADADADMNTSLTLVSKNMIGTVIREPRRGGAGAGDSSHTAGAGGTIVITNSNSNNNNNNNNTTTDDDEQTLVRKSQTLVTKAKMLESLLDFVKIIKISNLTEVLMEEISLAEVRLYYELLTDPIYTSSGASEASGASEGECKRGALYGIVCELATRTASNGQLSTGLQALRVKVLVPNPESSYYKKIPIDVDAINKYNTKYLQWLNDSRRMIIDSTAAFAAQQARNDAKRKELDTRNGNGNPRSNGRNISYNNNGSNDVAFTRNDTNDIYGAIGRDMSVTFELYIDNESSQRIAKNVKLTDEPIGNFNSNGNGNGNGNGEGEGEETRINGVFESVFSRGTSRYGYIRVIHNDEKLYFAGTVTVAGSNNNTTPSDSNSKLTANSAATETNSDIVTDTNPKTTKSSKRKEKASSTSTSKNDELKMIEGECITFRLRRRGGLRTAVDIQVDKDVTNDNDTPTTTTTTSKNKILGLVVSSTMVTTSSSQEQFFIPLDAKYQSNLSNKFWNYKLAQQQQLVAQQYSRSRTNGRKQESDKEGWARKDLDSDTVTTTATKEKENIITETTASTEVVSEEKEKPDVAATASTVTTTNIDDSDAKYYPALPRIKIPLDISKSNSTYKHTSSDGTEVMLPGYIPGTLVYCNAVTNFKNFKQPITMCDPVLATSYDTTKLEADINVNNTTTTTTISIPKAGRLFKRRGVITKLSIKLRPDGSVFYGNDNSLGGNSSGNGSGVTDGLELTEIRELPSNVDPAMLLELGQLVSTNGDSVFYCDSREIIALNGGNGNNTNTTEKTDSIQQNDEVEFYGVVAAVKGSGKEDDKNTVNIAAFTHQLPSKSSLEGINFKRSVNSSLKLKAMSQAQNIAAGSAGASKPTGVVMAKGPSEDGSIGFPEGWRSAHTNSLNATDLPWAHLLPYSISQTNANATSLDATSVENIDKEMRNVEIISLSALEAASETSKSSK